MLAISNEGDLDVGADRFGSLDPGLSAIAVQQ